MSVFQLMIILPTSIAVARAFIYFGEMEYRGKWLNYAIAVAGGLLGAELGLKVLPSVAFLFCLASAIAFTGLYQLLRWRVILWQTSSAKAHARTESFQIREFLAKS